MALPRPKLLRTPLVYAGPAGTGARQDGAVASLISSPTSLCSWFTVLLSGCSRERDKFSAPRRCVPHQVGLAAWKPCSPTSKVARIGTHRGLRIMAWRAFNTLFRLSLPRQATGKALARWDIRVVRPIHLMRFLNFGPPPVNRLRRLPFFAQPSIRRRSSRRLQVSPSGTYSVGSWCRHQFPLQTTGRLIFHPLLSFRAVDPSKLDRLQLLEVGSRRARRASGQAGKQTKSEAQTTGPKLVGEATRTTRFSPWVAHPPVSVCISKDPSGDPLLLPLFFRSLACARVGSSEGLLVKGAKADSRQRPAVSGRLIIDVPIVSLRGTPTLDLTAPPKDVEWLRYTTIIDRLQSYSKS